MNWEQKWESLARRWLPAAYRPSSFPAWPRLPKPRTFRRWPKNIVSPVTARIAWGIGPALLPENLERLRKPEAAKVIRESRPATQMPAFGDKLQAEESRH